MIYFSKSSNGFFLDSINDNMPADIVEINADLYNALMAGQQNDGKVIESDDDGGNDSNLLIVFYVQIMPDDFVMQLHRF